MYTSIRDAPADRVHTDFPAELSGEPYFRVCSQVCEYPAIAASCGRARIDVAEMLTEAGLPEDGIETGRLVTSELFTNALIHHRVSERETVKLIVSTAPGLGHIWVILTVVDTGSGALPQNSAASSDTDESGRGLALVRGLGARVTGRRLLTGYLWGLFTPVWAVARVDVAWLVRG